MAADRLAAYLLGQPAALPAPGLDDPNAAPAWNEATPLPLSSAARSEPNGPALAAHVTTRISPAHAADPGSAARPVAATRADLIPRALAHAAS
jgi:hypothetical protein